MDQHRDFDVDTNGFARLAGFTGDGNRRQQEDQAVKPPTDIERDNAGIDAVVVVGTCANNTGDHADSQQNGNDQMRAYNPEIKVANVKQRPFIRHVELATLRENHGHGGWQYQVECQHQIVDFTPEAVAIAAIHPRVEVNRQEQVRQRIGKHQTRRRVNNVEVEQQIGQRRG
ncbi:hypothetical protein D3C80_1025300 [compost metagenome]